MAINFPGPYELRIIYTANVAGITLTHTMRLNLDVAGTPDPGEDPADILVTRRIASLDPADDALDAVIDEWIALIQPRFNSSSVNFVRAELWSYPTESFDADFVTSYDIGLPGTNAGGVQAAGQVIYTFRTIEGGIMRLSLMEDSSVPGAATSLASQTGTVAAIRDFIVSTANWVLARDTSYPFASMNYSPGTNEAVFKKRFRQLT